MMRIALQYLHEIVLAILLVGLLVVAGVLDSSFVQPATQIELSLQVWPVAMLAVPMTFIILTGGIDLSVGSTIALSAVVLGMSFAAGVPIFFAGTLAILCGAACGAVNGLFVAKVRVHPLIATLATLAAFRGVAEGISQAKPVSGFPKSFLTIGGGTMLGLPTAAWMFVVAVIVAAVVLGKMPAGRFVRAIGFNEKAARFSGIGVDRIKLALYTLSGTAAGIAAVVMVSRYDSAKADQGNGIELDAITAVVLGGTSIFGGRGSILGTVLGIALIFETTQFVTWRYSRAELNPIVVGTLLIVAVAATSVRKKGLR